MPEATGKSELSPFKDLDVTRKITRDSGIWIFRAGGLAGRAMHTGLRREPDEHGGILWLDWPDILDHPERVRVLILIGHISDAESANIAEKLERTRYILDSVSVYNDLMMDRKRAYTKEEVEQMLEVPHLPRPEVALIDADRRDFNVFFNQKGFKQGKEYAGAYQVPWDKFVELARDGHLPLF